MRLAPLVLFALLAPPLAAASTACPGASHAERDLAEGHELHTAHAVCVSPASGTLQAAGTLVTPEGNVTLLATHSRAGERTGAHGVSETVDVRVLGTNATTTYQSSRTAAGYTTCGVRGTYVLPSGDANVGQGSPVCVPQEALQP